MSRAWFSYLGTGNVLAPASYTYTPVAPTCINGRIVCAIYSQNIGALSPGAFSQNLITYIAAGRATGLPQPMSPIGSKKYVYFLPLPI
jgi:hypothetical protein